MAIYPYANKTRLVKLLRDLGHDIPSIRRAEFSSFHRTYWLAWEDSAGKWHKASYLAATYGPVLIVDRKTTELALSTVKQYGLTEEKEKAPACAGTQTKA